MYTKHISCLRQIYAADSEIILDSLSYLPVRFRGAWIPDAVADEFPSAFYELSV